MDAERLMKRIDAGFDQLIHPTQQAQEGPVNGSAPSAGAGAGAGAAFMYRSNLVNPAAAPSATSNTDRAERLEQASLSVQERIKLKGWHTPSR